MKKLNLMVIVTVFTMILLCSCAQNNDVMASVNGIDIKKSDYEMRLKSNEIMAELMTEDINNSDFTSEEKNAKIMEIKEKCSTDKETIINSMIETAFIDSKYDSITHEQAKSEIEKQMSNLDDYAVEYPQVAANGKIMDEYIKRMGITKEEYLDLAADSYISLTAEAATAKAGAAHPPAAHSSRQGRKSSAIHRGFWCRAPRSSRMNLITLV